MRGRGGVVEPGMFIGRRRAADTALAAAALAFAMLLASCSAQEPDSDAAATQPTPTSASSGASPTGSPRPVEFRVVAASSVNPGGYGTSTPVPLAGGAASSGTDTADPFGVLDVDCADPPAPPAADESGVVCDSDAVAYALEPASIVGGVEHAEALIPENQVEWAVDVRLTPQATAKFREVSAALYGTDQPFALVVDGVVVSAPTSDGVITDGRFQVSGSISEDDARTLAAQLTDGLVP